MTITELMKTTGAEIRLGNCRLWYRANDNIWAVAVRYSGKRGNLIEIIELSTEEDIVAELLRLTEEKDNDQ